MNKADNGWFDLVTPASPGTRYRFEPKPGLLVPDPMSRQQAMDIHDDSLVVDPSAYRWQSNKWCGRPWHDTVIYELHPGLCGGFNGIATLLPSLKELGITAIELMPIADFPGARNWGYDGVLPFAPDNAYGTPEDLKALVDRAHALDLMIFLDVVYNHFGPDGNYLHEYASAFFREDEHTPWGAALDFRQPTVRRYFIENALYWLEEYQIDGLRLDAVHAISSEDWLSELAQEIHKTFPARRIHLMLENDSNIASLLEHDFSAQWNDDIHHALHVLLTDETGGYYSDYLSSPIDMLAKCLHQGFAYQGEISTYRGGISRGSDSSRLPPDRFIFFLQNHDQIGNRAFGERLINLTSPESLRVAIALQLLSPQIPLLFMGEEIGCHRPFLYFTDHQEELAEAVRNGRKREFGQFPEFANPETLSRLPDPNAQETFEQCRIPVECDNAGAWRQFYRDLLSIRTEHVAPRMTGARSHGVQVLSSQSLIAEWLMGDGQVLTIALNFNGPTVSLPQPIGTPIFTVNNGATAQTKGQLPRNSLAASLHSGKI